MAHIFVTGSFGLIGAALTKALKNSGFSVEGIDIRAPRNSTDNGSILNLDDVISKMQECIGIIHLAAISRIVIAEDEPSLCWQTNVEATQALLECALKSPAKPWFIYASSREVFGQPTILPVKETHPLLPMNVYGRSKLAAEQATIDAARDGLKTAILRFSNVYGSVEDHHDRVIPAFCRAALEGRPLRVEGSKNTFDFTHVNDVVEATLRAVHALSNTDKSLPTMNIVTGRGTSLADLASLICDHSKSSSVLTEHPPRNFDISTFYGDPTFAHEILGWKARVSLEEGLAEFISRLQSELSGKVRNVRLRAI